MNNKYNSQMLDVNSKYYSTKFDYNIQNNIFAQNSTDNFFPKKKNVFYEKNKVISTLLNINCKPFYPKSKNNILEKSDLQKITLKRKNSFNSENSSDFSDKNNRDYSPNNSQISTSTKTSFTKEDTPEDSEKKIEIFQNKKVETETKNTYQINPILENTEILKVNVKISKNNYAIFKLKRYDDIFYTIKLFCEINGVKEELIKPLIVKSLCALNTIYQVMNSKMDNDNINLLKKIKNNEFGSN